MTQEDEIEELQIELQSNPKSPLFAKLAELYLSREMIEEAESLIKRSLRYHPKSTSGLILMGRIFKLKKLFAEALAPLTEATKLAPENWRAWLELAEAHLELKNGKLALAAFKKVLLFNPTHALARRAVAKLELLSADEYEDDLFQMQKLPETDFKPDIIDSSVDSWSKPNDALVRMISCIDALIVRHDIEKALSLLNECSAQFGTHPEIDSRRLKLSVFEQADYLKPRSVVKSSLARQKLIKEKKIAILQMLLRRIEANKSDLLST